MNCFESTAFFLISLDGFERPQRAFLCVWGTLHLDLCAEEGSPGVTNECSDPQAYLTAYLKMTPEIFLFSTWFCVRPRWNTTTTIVPF